MDSRTEGQKDDRRIEQWQTRNVGQKMTERRKDIRIVGQKAITTVGQLDRRTAGQKVGQKDDRRIGQWKTKNL